MKKLTKTNELLWVFGTVCVAIGVALCGKADLGVSMMAAPAFVISDALIKLSPFFTVGVCEYLFQGLLLVIMCVGVRRFSWKYLLTFAAAVIYGYTLDLFLFIFSPVVVNGIVMRYVFLILGDVIVAFGVACFFRTYLPLQEYELFVAEVASRFGKDINKVKRVFDVSLMCVSLILVCVFFVGRDDFNFLNIWKESYHSIGLGTIITTIINAPLIKFFGKVTDRIFEPTALFPKLYKFLKR